MNALATEMSCSSRSEVVTTPVSSSVEDIRVTNDHIIHYNHPMKFNTYNIIKYDLPVYTLIQLKNYNTNACTMRGLVIELQQSGKKVFN
jgi:hypothetical protein